MFFFFFNRDLHDVGAKKINVYALNKVKRCKAFVFKTKVAL